MSTEPEQLSPIPAEPNLSGSIPPVPELPQGTDTPANEPVVAPIPTNHLPKTQEELDALIGKRLAQQQRAINRQQMDQQFRQPSIEEPKGPAPEREYFASDEEYLSAAIKYNTQKELVTFQKQAQANQAQVDLMKWVDQGLDKYPDFQEISLKIPVLDEISLQAIRQLPNGHDVTYHLGKNLNVAAELSGLSGLEKVIRLAQISESIKSATKPTKPVTSAPNPISPVNPTGTSRNMDPRDPEASKDMSMDEWARARNKQYSDGYKANRR